MKNTAKTLTLSAKPVKPAANAKAQPNATLVEPLDPAQAAAPVTVVRKRTRVVAKPEEAAAAQAEAAPQSARPAAAKKVVGKPLPAQEPPRGAAPPVSQTTDAAALAGIDTSGYVLPSVKVPGRRGRKPSEFT